MGETKKIVLIGGGGHCRSVLDSLLSDGSYSEILITDNSYSAGSTIMGCKVVGTDDILQDLYDSGVKYTFITIGSIGRKGDVLRRQKAFERAKKIGFAFPNIIDPSAVISKYTHLKEGVYVGKRAVINTGVSVGAMSIINTGAIVEHDCSIGSFAHVSVGVVICGQCSIGDYAFVGTNASIIQCIKIGDGSIIGAGAVVKADIRDNCTAVGVPARVIGDNNEDR